MVDYALLPYTLLSLPMYAKVLGINPMHFMRGGTPGLNPVIMPDSGCDAIWFKYDWQHADQVSHFQIAETIQMVEVELANALGYWPAPTWIYDRDLRYPRTFGPEYYGTGIDVRGRLKSVNANYGKIIRGGQRAVSLIATATVAGGTLVYSDEDADGYFETATITLPTTLTSRTEIKVFYPGMSGVLEAEIRPLRKMTLSAGSVSIKIDSWLMIKPELYEDLPTSEEGARAIDISTTANFLTSVDVYREYVDATQPDCSFTWDSDMTSAVVGTDEHSRATQTGYIDVRDAEAGIIAPIPANYDATIGKWTRENWVAHVEPGNINAHYLSGEQSSEYLRGVSLEPLSFFWAQVIAWMTTARLERPLCTCNATQAIHDDLRVDLTYHQTGSSYFVADDVLTSPFGTRKGEVMAWRRIRRMVRRRLRTALV